MRPSHCLSLYSPLLAPSQGEIVQRDQVSFRECVGSVKCTRWGTSQPCQEISLLLYPPLLPQPPTYSPPSLPPSLPLSLSPSFLHSWPLLSFIFLQKCCENSQTHRSREQSGGGQGLGGKGVSEAGRGFRSYSSASARDLAHSAAG